MAFSLTLPLLERNATTKDYIVSILSYEWPLTTKKMHSAIRKKFGRNVTYQAVYKTLKDLEADKVLRHSDEGYEINDEWVKKLHRFTEIVESNYFARERLTAIEGLKESRKEGSINVLTFETYFDTEKYIHYLLKYSLLNSKSKLVCMHHAHEWVPLLYLRAEYNKAINAQGQGIAAYRLCNGSTATDKWAAEFYRKLGCKAKTGVSCADVCDLIVVGDIVIQVYLPTEVREALAKAFAKAKSISDLDITRLITEVFERKTSLEVVISRNEKIASQIREKTLAYFKH